MDRGAESLEGASNLATRLPYCQCYAVLQVADVVLDGMSQVPCASVI